MRTITETLKNRLQGQLEEAKIQGLTKTSSILSNKVENVSTRENTASYTYPSNDVKNDVESVLWDAFIRVADFHNTAFDIKEAQNIIEKFSEEFIKELRVTANINHGIGNYEPTVPGEERNQVVLLIDENE